jgi:DNA-binding GntR family transcriptional regulator
VQEVVNKAYGLLTSAGRRQMSLAEQAYELLEEMIITLLLPPGTKLTEAVLIDRTGFGRTPIREALQRLSDVGLIEVAPRRATKVTRVDVGDQLRLLEVRRELDRLIATSAARRRTSYQSSMLSDMATAMRTAAATDDYLLFLRIDQAFNQCVAESAGNRHLLKAISPIHALSRRFWYMHYRPYDLSIAAVGHAEIMEAIVDRDVRRAAEASDALLDYVESFTRTRLPSGDQIPAGGWSPS